METLDVKRGLIKNLSSEGGLAGVARKYFDNVQGQGDTFSGSHGIMSKISGEYNGLGRLVVDVVNELPDFEGLQNTFQQALADKDSAISNSNATVTNLLGDYFDAVDFAYIFWV